MPAHSGTTSFPAFYAIFPCCLSGKLGFCRHSFGEPVTFAPGIGDPKNAVLNGSFARKCSSAADGPLRSTSTRTDESASFGCRANLLRLRTLLRETGGGARNRRSDLPLLHPG